MKAVAIRNPGGPEVLSIVDIAPPAMKPGHLRVQVRAAALNRADLLQRRGLYPPPPGESEILGLEMAGEIIEIAPDVAGFAKGERVCALLPGGGYAQEVVVPAGLATRLPANMSFEEGAAIPEAFLTAYSNLVWLGGMQRGHRVLIHAGASGVGTAAIQLVRELGGRSIVTAGTPEKRAVCLEMGADQALDYKKGPFVNDVLAWSEGAGVQIVLDFVGASYLEQNLQTLAVDGRLVVIGTMGGATADQVDLGLLLRRRLQIIGTALRSRTLDQKVRLTNEFWNFAGTRFADGRLRPVVDRVFPMPDVAEAHRYMESNRNIGKIVMSIDNGV